MPSLSEKFLIYVMIGLNQKIQFTIYKIRNIVYYRGIDQRPRAQYIHILRQLRLRLFRLIQEISRMDDYKEIKSFFNKIFSCINPEIKSEECESVIEKIKIIYEQREKKETV